jgi:hypothetical protein
VVTSAIFFFLYQALNRFLGGLFVVNNHFVAEFHW